MENYSQPCEAGVNSALVTSHICPHLACCDLDCLICDLFIFLFFSPLDSIVVPLNSRPLPAFHWIIPTVGNQTDNSASTQPPHSFLIHRGTNTKGFSQKCKDNSYFFFPSAQYDDLFQQNCAVLANQIQAIVHKSIIHLLGPEKLTEILTTNKCFNFIITLHPAHQRG